MIPAQGIAVEKAPVTTADIVSTRTSKAPRILLLERLGWGLLVVVLLIGFPLALARVVHDGCTDFTGFCEAGHYVLEHGAGSPTSVMGRYWPSADVPWVLFACIPLWIGASLWYAVGSASWFGLLRTICRELLDGPDQIVHRQSTLAAGLLVAPLAIDGLCLGSFHILVIWLMLAGLLRANRGQACSGGILLGVAVWLKLLPLLGVGYLLLKRRWTPALIAVVFAVSLDMVLSLGAFGMEGAWREHVAWWNHGAAGSTLRQLTSPRVVDEDRLTNQSVAVTLRRLLSSRGAEPASPRQCVVMAHFTPGQLEAAFLVATALLAMAVAAFCCRPESEMPAVQGPMEIALIVLATLWFSPVVWSYHLTAATPALAMLLTRHRAAGRWRAIAIVAFVWLLALCLLAWPVARNGRPALAEPAAGGRAGPHAPPGPLHVLCCCRARPGGRSCE